MNTTKIHIAPATQLAFNVDAIVEEQDTYLLLDTGPVVQDTNEEYETLISKMKRQKPLVPGQVIVRNTRPKKLVAVIYDIEQKPACRKEWLLLALENIFRKCVEHKIRIITMPYIGSRHGNIEPQIFLELLQDTLDSAKQDYPENIFITQESTIDTGDFYRTG